MAFTHRYTLICDDTRREDNGKLILIGLYMDSIIVPQLPATFPGLTFFTVLDADRPGHWGIELKLDHLETGKTLVQGRGGIDVKQPGPVISPLKFGPVQFQATGAYSFVMQIQDEREPLITNFTVQFPPAGYSFPQQR